MIPSANAARRQSRRAWCVVRGAWCVVRGAWGRGAEGQRAGSIDFALGFRSHRVNEQICGMNLKNAAQRLSALAGTPLRPYSTRDHGRKKYPKARSVLCRSNRTEEIIYDLRRELGPGLIAFIGCEESFAKPRVKGKELVVAKGTTQFDILRVADSHAGNYSMDTEDLVAKLAAWDEKHGIDIFHAETDKIEFKFLKMPRNLKAFCKDLYAFCPDIVNQGCEDLETLAASIARRKSVYLWWD
jgi:hypothetical protein